MLAQPQSKERPKHMCNDRCNIYEQMRISYYSFCTNLLTTIECKRKNANLEKKKNVKKIYLVF